MKMVLSIVRSKMRMFLVACLIVMAHSQDERDEGKQVICWFHLEFLSLGG